MTQDEIIRMAREAGLIQYVQVEKTCVSNALERFAALVAAHEKKFWMEQIEVECNEAVLAEREACAEVCDEQFQKYGCVADKCAAAIRARGDK